MERCFLCYKKMDKKTGLCTNPKCVRSKLLKEKKEREGEGNKMKGDYHETHVTLE